MITYTIVVAAIILVGAYAFAAHHFVWWPFTAMSTTHIETGASIKNQAQQNQSIGSSDSKSNSKSSGSVGSTPVPSPTPGQNGSKSTIPVTITSVHRSGDILQIRTLIGAVTTGTCTLTLTGPGSTYTETSDTQSLPSSSTCSGFSVPTSKLASGTWNITVDFENNSLRGSASQEVTI